MVDLQLTQSSVNSGRSQLLGQLLGRLSNLANWFVEDVLVGVLLASLGRLELVGSGISNGALLWLVGSSGEEDQLALVIFKSLNVELESLFGTVGSSVVDSDTYGLSESWGDLGSLEFLQCEASSVS